MKPVIAGDLMDFDEKQAFEPIAGTPQDGSGTTHPTRRLTIYDAYSYKKESLYATYPRKKFFFRGYYAGQSM